MQQQHVLASTEDASVNFATPFGTGFLEARYVRRDSEKVLAYLSSQSGCNQACRFCHLTRTRQTSFDHAGIDDLLAQLDSILEHYSRVGETALRLNINFMARGEPLLNPNLMKDFDHFAKHATIRAENAGITTLKFNISTIMPRQASDVDLVKVFGSWPVNICWSLYTTASDFRRRWLPKADDPETTAARLRRWQDVSGRDIVIHHALIAGENDRDSDLSSITDLMERHGLRAKLNLVRYNPADIGTGAEASEDRYRLVKEKLMPSMKASGTRIVPRVGFDVKASCGMFLSAGDIL